MGRPVQKRYFGALDDGTNITVSVKVGSNAISEEGMILRQRASNKFKVDDSKLGSGNEGICKLVNKENSALSDNEMVLFGYDSAQNKINIRRLYNRQAHDYNGNRYKWSVVNDSSVSYMSLTLIS